MDRKTHFQMEPGDQGALPPGDLSKTGLFKNAADFNRRFATAQFHVETIEARNQARDAMNVEMEKPAATNEMKARETAHETPQQSRMLQETDRMLLDQSEQFVTADEHQASPDIRATHDPALDLFKSMNVAAVVGNLVQRERQSQRDQRPDMISR